MALFMMPNLSLSNSATLSSISDNTNALNTGSSLWHGYVAPSLWSLWSSVTVFRVVLLFLVLANVKIAPMVWHIRILNAFTHTLKVQRPKNAPTASQLFQPLITTTHVPMMEIDFQQHNIDIARAHLVCTLFSEGIEHFRGGTGAYTGSKLPHFACALGAVSCSFKKELKAYETYELWTRVLSWDEKWIYIVTHFVRKGAVKPSSFSLYPEQNVTGADVAADETDAMTAALDPLAGHPAVVATALSKCVFKSGRRTVSPAFMFKLCGILPPRQKNDSETDTDGKVQTGLPPLDSCKSSDSGIAVNDSDCESDLDRELEHVERERQRGMKVALALAADNTTALEMEFTGTAPALARHFDGVGIAGVVRCWFKLCWVFAKERVGLVSSSGKSR